MLLLLNPRRTRTNMKLLQLVGIFLLTLCGQSGITAVTVKEDGEAILNCSFGTNIKNKPFAWKKDVDQSNEDVFWYSGGDTDPGPEFKGRVFHFPDQLQFGNASIKITKAKTSDSGTYTCYHATVQKEIKSTISLTVGAAPRPFITVHKTNDGMLLQCEVLGAFPKPEVEWWDSDGNVLAVGDPQMRNGKGNKYDTVINVTVIKSGDYRCVATQREIYHQIYTKTHANVGGGASKPNAKEINETKDGILLQCVVQDPSPQTKVFWKDSAGQDVPSKEQKTENSIILWTTVTTTDDYCCVTTEGKKDDELYDEIRVKVTEETKTDKSSGEGFGVGTIVVTALITAVVVGGVLLTVGIVLFQRFKSKYGGSTPEGGKKEGYVSTEQTSDD